MYRPSGRARRLFCRVIFPGKRSRRKPGRYGIGPYSGAGGVAAMRRRLWQGGVRGGMRASRPTDVLWVLQPGKSARFRRGKACRGGFHIRPGCWRRRKAGRYGIGPYSGAGGGAAKGGVYGGAGARQMRHCCIPHKEIYARRRKLRAYILQDIGRGAKFSAARLCGRFTGSPRRGGI